MPKTSPNVALKAAIAATGEFQKRIASKARVDPQRLSNAIRGRTPLRDTEMARIARVLCKPESELFPAA
jgi:hypothetical protein